MVSYPKSISSSGILAGDTWIGYFCPPCLTMLKAVPLGYSGFQVMGVIEWSQNSRPKKIPGPKINPQKIPCRFCGP